MIACGKLRVRIIIRPRAAVGPYGARSRNAWIRRGEYAEIVGKRAGQVDRILAAGIGMERHFKALRNIRRGLRIGERSVWKYVRRAADAFPISDAAARSALRQILVKASCGTAVAVVVSGTPGAAGRRGVTRGIPRVATRA